MKKHFPTTQSYMNFLIGDDTDSPEKNLFIYFVTPPQHVDGGTPRLQISATLGSKSIDPSKTQWALNRRGIADLRDWCERTLFALDFPERYEENTEWKEWFEFSAPQRAGFTVNAFESCDRCFMDKLDAEEHAQ